MTKRIDSQNARDKRKTPAIRFGGFDEPWELRKLGEICHTFEYGLNAAAKEFDGQNKYLRITDIDDITRKFLKTSLTSPDANLSNQYRYMLQDGDIIFARTGASVGKTYLYDVQDGMVFFAGFLIRAKIKPNNAAEFIFQATLTEAYSRFIAITSQRSGQPGVNAQEYSEWMLNIPNNEAEQTKIGAFFRSLDDLITLRQRKYDKLVKVKKSMLEKLFPKNGSNVPEIRFSGFTGPWESRKFSTFVQRKTEIGAEPELPRVEYEDIIADYGRLNKDISKKESRAC